LNYHPFTARALTLLALTLPALGALAACAPQAGFETNVQPTLISVTAPGEFGGELVLQGRYFGDGEGGEDDSYVILGADISGEGGGRIETLSWSPSKIILNVPRGAGYGYVFVVVDGVVSNGLPANLP
jgi:hypothetical protein